MMSPLLCRNELARLQGATSLVMVMVLSWLGAMSSARAQSRAPIDAIRHAGAQGRAPALRALSERGVIIERMASLEMLPGGQHALAEIVLRSDTRRLRLPVQLQRQSGQGDCADSWTVSWTPEPSFAIALVTLAGSSALPRASRAEPWVKRPRLPAMPLVVTRDKVRSPFGTWALPPDGASEDGKISSEIDPPRRLLLDIQRWTQKILRKDPGPAGIDVIADGRVSWQALSRILFGAGSMGFFRFTFVARSPSGELVGVLGAAPVFGGVPDKDRPKPWTLGIYPGAATTRVRASLGDRLVLREDACAPDTSFCQKKPGALSESWKALLEKEDITERPRHVLVAAPRTATLHQLVPWIDATPEALDVAPERLFVGYIGGAP